MGQKRRATGSALAKGLVGSPWRRTYCDGRLLADAELQHACIGSEAHSARPPSGSPSYSRSTQGRNEGQGRGGKGNMRNPFRGDSPTRLSGSSSPVLPEPPVLPPPPTPHRHRRRIALGLVALLVVGGMGAVIIYDGRPSEEPSSASKTSAPSGSGGSQPSPSEVSASLVDIGWTRYESRERLLARTSPFVVSAPNRGLGLWPLPEVRGLGISSREASGAMALRLPDAYIPWTGWTGVLRTATSPCTDRPRDCGGLRAERNPDVGRRHLCLLFGSQESRGWAPQRDPVRPHSGRP